MSNYQFKTQNIKGKEYVPVQERIKFFRQEEQYKNWSIINEIVAVDDQTCIIKCIVADESGRHIAVGHAQEDRTSSMINKTSFVENCESSAVGRALAFLGIGVDTSIASANEVSMAISKQDLPEKKKRMSQDILDKMKKAITDGRAEEVKKALSNYEYTEEQYKALFV